MTPKFRAWEKNLKEMISVDSINFEAGLINMELAWRTFEEIELMQYTGLKDSNGVEIYEGDVLMAGDAYLGVIKYDSTRAQFIGKNIGETFQEDEYDTLYTKNGRFNSAKVIGNIYENPELLED